MNSEIYLAGCLGYCKGCHSPHTHNKHLGTPIKSVINKLYESIDKWYDRGFIDNIVILGGEPLDNEDAELASLLSDLKERYSRCNLWLYTHFELKEVKQSHPNSIKLLDYIKCGKFDKSLASEEGFKHEETGVVLATSNQYIVNLKEENLRCIN